VNTLANHNRQRQRYEPIRTVANTCNWHQARENAHEQVTIAFRFISTDQEKVDEVVASSLGKTKTNPGVFRR